MPLSDLPLLVQQHILAEMNQTKDSYYEVKDNEIHVTETLYCITKSHFKRKNPKATELRAAFNMYRGNELDNRWTPLFPDNQKRCTHRVNGYPFCIVGKYDFFDPADQALGDLKTVKNLFYSKEGPKAEHVKQIRFYCYCNAIFKAKIVYVDYGDCITHPVEISDELCNQAVDEIESKAIALYESLKTGIPPREDMSGKEWLCGFGKEWQCEYYFECHGLDPNGAIPTMEELAVNEVKRIGKKKK
jgi:CRISPR-associated exonuclease Cas4